MKHDNPPVVERWVILSLPKSASAYATTCMFSKVSPSAIHPRMRKLGDESSHTELVLATWRHST